MIVLSSIRLDPMKTSKNSNKLINKPIPFAVFKSIPRVKFNKCILCNENAEILLNSISMPKFTVGKIYQFVPLNFIVEDSCSFEDLNPSGFAK